MAINTRWPRTAHRAVKILTGLAGPRIVQSPRRNAFASSSKVSADTPKVWHLSPPPVPTPSKQTQSHYNDPITRLKHPSRGGRDLSARYVRLERALRGKEEYERDIAGMEKGEVNEGATGGSISDDGRVRGKGKAQTMFAGFVIPEIPKPPEPDGASSLLSHFLKAYCAILPFRVLHVRLRRLRTRSLRRSARGA